MRLAVMQPYVFPYIGYFQLIHAVDNFVFYDDVNYIKGGWINRNRILLNGADHLLTVPCIQASPYKQINEIEFDNKNSVFQKIPKTIELAYKKAPYFNQVFALINDILKISTNKISVLAEQSIKQISHYLNMNAKFRTSSISFPQTKALDKAARLIEICKRMNSNHYINPIGGMELYSKQYFQNYNVELNFIRSSPIVYKQFNNEFIPWLSIIDVLMFNSVEEIAKMLNQYSLE